MSLATHCYISVISEVPEQMPSNPIIVKSTSKKSNNAVKIIIFVMSVQLLSNAMRKSKYFYYFHDK